MSAAELAMIDPLNLLHSTFASQPMLGGVSPSTSGTDEYDFTFGDDDAEGENEESYTHGGSEGSPPQSTFEAKDGKRRSRRPPATAAKRATHNAVERARRESLNGRFLELASHLPAMASVKRPSKNAIVEKALDFVTRSTERESQLITENTAILTELNALRAQLGLPPPVSQVQAVKIGMVKKPAKQQSPPPTASAQALPVAVATNVAKPRSPAAEPKVQAQAVAPMPSTNAAAFAHSYGAAVLTDNKATATLNSAATESYIQALASFDWPQAQAQTQPQVPFQQARMQQQIRDQQQMALSDLYGPFTLDPLSFMPQTYAGQATTQQQQQQQQAAWFGPSTAGLAFA